MNSLQQRLILGVATVFVAGFLVASLAIYLVTRSTMYAEFDAALQAQVRALAASTIETHDGVRFELGEGFEEFERSQAPSYYQVWSGNAVIARSPQLNGDLDLPESQASGPQFAASVLPDGRAGRRVWLSFTPKFQSTEVFAPEDWLNDEEPLDWESIFRELSVGANPPQRKGEEPELTAESGIFTVSWYRPPAEVTITVARATTQLDRWLTRLLWILPLVGTATTALSSFVLVWVVRRGLVPLAHVTQAIVSIDQHTLGQRVPTQGVPDEIVPTVNRLNELLARLEDAFQQERTFSSNLAHELRTPLAGLHSTLEVYLSRQHEPHEYESALSTCLQICVQSERLVEALLGLARVEVTSFTAQQDGIALDALVAECWSPFAASAEARQLQTSFDVASMTVTSDRELLRVILRNVLENAVSHCDPGGDIRVTTRETPDAWGIRVTNSGNQLSGDAARHVFDRLWRGDQARQHTGQHFGLGLTITKRFTEALGGQVHVQVNDRFSVEVSLPKEQREDGRISLSSGA